MIKCLLCGYESKSMLGQHIKHVHKMTSDEYTKLTGGEVTSKEFKARMDRHNKSDEMRKVTAERNKSEYMRNIISERNKDPEFIEKCVNGMTTPEESERRSKLMTYRNLFDTNLQESLDKVDRSQVAKEWSNKPHNKERFRKLMHKNWSDPEIASKMLNAPKKSSFSKRGTYKGVFGAINYKSSGELEFIKQMELFSSEITKLTYEPFAIQYYNSESRQVSNYYPDFLVECSDVHYLVEIKFSPSQFDEQNSKDKALAASKYCDEQDTLTKYIRLDRFSIGNILKLEDLINYK